jgi:hypothetical protein
VLSNLKSKIKDVEEKRKNKREEKEREKQERVEQWNKEQEKLKNDITNYFLKYESFVKYIKCADFQTLYKIYNENKEYIEYINLYRMLKELRNYNYSKHEGPIDNQAYFRGERDGGLSERINKYYNIELMITFKNSPYRFKELIAPYEFLDENLYEIVKKQFIKKLDDVLWESYGSVQVEKIKFFYDIFLKEGRATTVDFSVKLDANSSTMINGSGNGDIEYKSRQSIYDFVFSDIKYCKLLDEINN